MVRASIANSLDARLPKLLRVIPVIWGPTSFSVPAVLSATGFSLEMQQSLMARGRNAAVMVFLIASVHKWPALTEVLAKIDMILPLQEAQK